MSADGVVTELWVVVVDRHVKIQCVWHEIVVQGGGHSLSTMIDTGQSRVSIGDIYRNGERDIQGVIYCPRVTGDVQDP